MRWSVIATCTTSSVRRAGMWQGTQAAGFAPDAELRAHAAPVRAAGRLEVTLHADVDLPLRREPRRVDDAAAHVLEGGRPGARQVDVPRPGSVAPLTVDPRRQVLREELRCYGAVVARRYFGIPVVAEKAGVRDRPEEVGLVGAIVSGAHPPGPLLRVPGDRQLGHFARRRPMQVTAGVPARADHEGHLPFVDPYRPPVRVMLRAPLDETPVSLEHFVGEA